MPEQIEIVRILDSKLDKLSKSLKKIELVNQLNMDVLKQFNAIKTSILDTAFSGKLIN